MSNSPMKNGKESIKNRYEILKEMSYTEMDKFALDDKQKDYLKTNGLVGRFIHRKAYLDANNFHKSGWRVINDPDLPGVNSEGLLIIGDLVLAVKTNEHQAIHRKRLQEKADRYNPTKSEQMAARELKDAAKKVHSSARIYEGYEKNSPDEKDED